MNYKIFTKGMRTLVLMLAALVLAAGPSYAVDLMAVEGTWTPPGVGSTPITMWGFATDTGDCLTAPTLWSVGPELDDADLVTGNLTINLRNCLTEPTSIVIPGQPASFAPVRIGNRVTAFTTEALADGGLTTYTWTGVKSGTYLYQSGSHPAMQVQMGLYGALTIRNNPADGTPMYPDTSGDVTLLYSEIDPALHSPPAAATPLGYKPRHYLVNGLESQPTTPVAVAGAGDTNLPTVLRFLNAGLDFHVPALNGGHMSLVAEDGNAYPFPKEQYSANLAAGKTIDALWQPASAGDHVIYDRRGNGMVASLAVTAGVGAPAALNDSYTIDEDTSLVTIAGNIDPLLAGVLDNDPGPGTLTAILVSAPSSGILSPNLATDGSFTYTPNADFSGSDGFTYKANDGTLDSNVASVTITVNPMTDAPVANDDAYDAIEGITLSVTAPGVLENDTDVDGDALNAILDTDPTAGTLSCPSNALLQLCSDGSFDYTADPVAVPGDTASFTYFANDGTENSAVAATVTITIVAGAPVAEDDAYDVIERTALSVAAPGVLVNDTDVNDDALNAVLDTGPTAGTLSCPSDALLQLCSDGSFDYTPDAGAVPGDTASFTYFANDGTENSAVAATVIFTIIANIPPVAVDDAETVVRNSPGAAINLTDNDSDVDDNLKDGLGDVAAAQITITTGATTTRGGTVSVVTNGVIYIPKRNFRGTDTFNYTVEDLAGAPSNEATVRVNVVRP